MRIADLRSAICRSWGFVACSPRRESAGLLPEGFSLDPSPVHRTLLRRRATLSPAVPTRGTLAAEAGRPYRMRTAALWTGCAFGAPHRPPFPHKEPSPLKQAVHTAARYGVVDGLRFRCTPSPAVPTQETLPAEAGRPYRMHTTALWMGSTFDAPHRPPFPHKEPSPPKRAVHAAVAPRLCGRALLSMHPIARRSHTRNPRR